MKSNKPDKKTLRSLTLPLVMLFSLSCISTLLVGCDDSISTNDHNSNSQELVQKQIDRVANATTSFKEALRLFQASDEPIGEAMSLNGLGIITQHELGQFEKSIEFHEQALNIFRKLNNRRGEAGTLNVLGVAYKNLGQFKESIEFHQQASEIFRELNDHAGEAGTLNLMGAAYRGLGQFERSVALHKQALEIFRELDNNIGEAWCLESLGISYSMWPDFKLSDKYFKEALAIVNNLNDSRQSWKLVGLDLDSIPSGLSVEATKSYQEAVNFLKEQENRELWKAEILSFQGMRYYQQYKVNKAIKLTKQSRNIYEKQDNVLGKVTIFHGLGSIYARQGIFEKKPKKLEDSIKYFKEALEINRQLNNRVGEAQNLNGLASAYSFSEKFNEAINFSEQALKIFQELKHRAGEGNTLIDLAYTRMAGLQDFEGAIDLLEEALEIHREQNNLID